MTDVQTGRQKILSATVAVMLQELQLQVWWWTCKLFDKKMYWPKLQSHLGACSCSHAATPAVASLVMDMKLVRQPIPLPAQMQRGHAIAVGLQHSQLQPLSGGHATIRQPSPSFGLVAVALGDIQL